MLRRHDWWWLLAGLALIPAAFGVVQWRQAIERNSRGDAEPFRIAGNFYYIGSSDVTSYLITGPNGHVLIDGGHVRTAPLIMASIKTLGFDIRDVKVLLNSEPPTDHAGGLAELKRASGAALWASEPSATVLAAGGMDPDMIIRDRIFVAAGIASYPAVQADHLVQDGDVVRVGPIALTAHITGGHSRGCTTWTFQIQDRDRTYNAASVCSLERPWGVSYPEQTHDFEQTFRTLRSLPIDIWVTSHARQWGRYRKFLESRSANDPVAPFVDPEGLRAFIDAAEAELAQGITH